MLRSYLPLIFDKRLFIYLSFSFIAFTIIGTLSHEWGHYVVARNMGWQSSIHYQSTSAYDTAYYNYCMTVVKKYGKEIAKNESFPGREQYYALWEQYQAKNALMLWGGPLQTMLTGTIGLLFLFIFRRKIWAANKLNTGQWLLVFISLFWLRQLANLVVAAGVFAIKGKITGHGDEFRLALYYEWPLWSICISTGVVALIISLWVIFKFVPASQRLTFIAAGLGGGVAGYILWLEIFGKMIMP